MRLMFTPLRFMVSSHIRIANEPSGKKCGPKLLPMMFEKTSVVKAWPLKATVEAMFCIDINPRMVMGQLLMKDAPTVTTTLGAITPSTDGSELAELRC